MTTIGVRIKQLRKESGLTQEDFGKIFGIVKSTVSLYENNKSIPDDEIKKKITQHFDVSLDFLMGVSDIRNPYKEKNILSKKDEKDIANDLENTLNRLEGAQDGLMFEGEALDDETRELLKISLENSMRLAKQIAKKYTPNKYKK